MPAAPGTYGGGVYGAGVYGGGLPRMPRQHVRIAFDRNGYNLGGICTGDNSTCESLGDWTAYANCSLSLNVNSAWCYAGTGSIEVTATSAGDAEVAVFGLGTGDAIVPGRTYLLWVHVRPQTQPRDVRVELLWKSATDVFLTAHIATRIESGTDWTRIGVLGTAPPAAGRLDIGVDWLGCEPGEVHYLDTVTVEDAGTDVTEDALSCSYTLSGRNAADGQTESGQATLVLENPAGRYTPGRAATTLAPYAGNITPRRRVWVLAQYGGVLYPVWSGYSTRWAPTYPGGLAGASEVTVTCDDGFRWLTAATVQPPYRAEILAAGPLSYYPLDEPGESASAGDLIAGYPAALLASGAGDGGSAFGGTSVLPTLIGGSTTDSGSSSLALHQDDDVLETSQGAVLDLRFAGGMPPQIGLADWSLEMWIVPRQGPPTGTAQVIYHQIVPDGAGIDYLSGFMLTIELTGQLRLSTGGSEVVATTPESICNATPHHVAVTYTSGGTYGVARLYRDGTLVGSADTLSSEPMPAGMPQVAQLGGASNTLTGAVQYRFQGRVGHVAHYYRLLSADEIADHYHAGADGYYLETEADRIKGVLRLAGWPDEDTRIDRGLTPLLPRDWAETNPLGILQSQAAVAGSVVVMDALGRLRYPNRYQWVNHIPVAADFREDYGTEVEFTDFAPWLDDEDIVNEYSVNRTSGASISVRDGPSIERYGLSKGPTLDIGAASDDETLTHAQWLLSRTAEPHTRIDTAMVRPDTFGATLWPMVLPLEFGHRITIASAPDTAPSAEIDALIGQISGVIKDNEWSVTFRLEAAQIDTMLVADDPVYGYLGMPAGY